MKVKTSELNGVPLNYALGVALGIELLISGGTVWKYYTEDELHPGEEEGLYEYRASADWNQCGLMIERIDRTTSQLRNQKIHDTWEQELADELKQTGILGNKGSVIHTAEKE